MIRSLLTLSAIALLAAPTVGAQAAGQHAHQMAKPALDAELTEHFKGITLTEAQIKQVMEIKAKAHKSMDMIKKNAKDPNDPTVKAAVQKEMDGEHAAFKALLTPDQMKVFEENMKAHHKAEAKNGKHEMKPGEKHEMEHKPAPKKP